MEHNEMFEDNGFENFEPYKKHTEIDKEILKNANEYANSSQKILIIESIVVCLGILLPGLYLESEWKYIIVGVMGIITFCCHFVSLYFAVTGYRIYKTKATKEMILLHKVIPLACVGMILIFLVIAYMFWIIFVGFMHEYGTFFEWLFMGWI